MFDKGSRNERLRQFLDIDFPGHFLAITVLLAVQRILTLVFYSKSHGLPENPGMTLLMGLAGDISVWMALLLLVLVFLLPVAMISRKTATILLWLAGWVFLLLEIGLSEYFRVTLHPLDQVVFSYSIKEMKMISGSSYRLNPVILMIPVLVSVLLFLAFRFRKILPHGRRVSTIILLLLLPGLLVSLYLSRDPSERMNQGEYFLRQNKTGFFLRKIMEYTHRDRVETSSLVLKQAVLRYQSDRPDMKFIGTNFPFLHENDSPDVLGPCFRMESGKPNVVIVIMESLSSCFIGDNAIFGSFTPFIDSLARHSLYWNNFLSTSDRTFNVLPALLGSLPPGDPSIMDDIGKLPYHLSLVRILKESGYQTNFFYGGDPTFNNMDEFMQRQGVGFILRDFGPSVPPGSIHDGYKWGYSDAELYRRSLELLDSMQAAPRLDIYLTLSLHAPFDPPEKSYWQAEALRRATQNQCGPSVMADVERYLNIFATVMYTDKALSNFFNSLKSRADFNNTIFIVTGDHGLPELNLHRFSPLHRYNVPLLIYSPMLIRPALFRSVSSHLDIAPSLVALLKEPCRLKPFSEVPWLGKGLDTSAAPRNTKSLAFIMNNKEINEYLDRDVFLGFNRLYNVRSELWTIDTFDAALMAGMKRKLSDFRMLNRLVVQNNRLMPEELYYGSRQDTAGIPVWEPLHLNPEDSTSEFRSILSAQPVPAGVNALEMNVSVSFMTNEKDTGKAPLLVFDLYGEKSNRLSWKSFKFRCKDGKPPVPGKWSVMTARAMVRVDHLKSTGNHKLELYIWNFFHCNVRFRDPTVTITGHFPSVISK